MLCICNTPWLEIIFKNKTTLNPLEDLDFADDLALVSHPHQHSSADKPEDQPEEDMVMKLNISKPLPVRVNGEDLPTTEEFTYLSSTAKCDRGAGNDVNTLFFFVRIYFIRISRLKFAKF